MIGSFALLYYRIKTEAFLDMIMCYTNFLSVMGSITSRCSGQEPALRSCRGGPSGIGPERAAEIEPVFARVFDESTNFLKTHFVF